MSIFALKTVAADDGVTMTIRHLETGLPMDGQTITLLGTDSRAYADYIAKRERSLMNSNLSFDKRINRAMANAEKNALDALVFLTIGWTLTGIDGKPVEFTKEAALELYSDPSMKWVREQAESFIQDRSNFLQK